MSHERKGPGIPLDVTPPKIRYVCDNQRCGAEKTSSTNLRIYGDCRECNSGVLRRVDTATKEERRG